jgi:hypothetical protein
MQKLELKPCNLVLLGALGKLYQSQAHVFSILRKRQAAPGCVQTSFQPLSQYQGVPCWQHISWQLQSISHTRLHTLPGRFPDYAGKRTGKKT